MRIGELALKAGVSTSRIRFYEAQGLLAPAPRTANGYRTYGPRDLKIIAFIERAQRLGFSLKDIGAFLTANSGQRPAPETLIGHLETKLREIDRHLAEARQRRRDAAQLLGELRG
jgi:MerR family copper efflux transcriptional regulator